MKKTFKGFTLVECLVAMAILSVACMALGAIEATVANRNNFNHFTNTSLANQMAYIEKYENTNTVVITSTHSGTTPPSGTNSGTSAYVKVTNTTTNDKYSFPVDIYVMYSRDTKDKGSNESGYGSVASSYSMDGSSEKESNLRYKYILGHN